MYIIIMHTILHFIIEYYQWNNILELRLYLLLLVNHE